MKTRRLAPAHRSARASGRRRDVLACAGLLAAGVLIRVPFLASFDLVSHDGTYYIAQARALLDGGSGGGAFPLGYPAAIALSMLVVADDVRAAQAVSVLAGLAASFILYFMGRDRFGRGAAWTCAALASATPLFVRLSLTTMSESLYVALIMGALLAALRSRAAPAGLLAGLAAATRPEALAVAAAMGVAWRRDLARVRAFGVAFALVYALGVVANSAFVGHVVLLPKWAPVGAGAGAGPLLRHYFTRLPADAAALFRHVGVAAFALGLWGAWRRRGIVVAALWPALINPLFTPRAEGRFVLPFVLPMLWLAFDAVAASAARARRWGLALLVTSGALVIPLDRGALTTPVSEGFAGARDVGRALRERVRPGARMADRKPFVAFYAGARYVELPDAPYDETVARLYGDGVEYISLLPGVVEFFRPDVRALLYDPVAIEGELRYEQIYVSPSAIVYERRQRAQSPRWTAVAPLGVPRPGVAPSLAPSGRRAALALGTVLVAVDLESGRFDTLFTAPSRLADAAYSPAGTRVAFVATTRGNADVEVLDLATGVVRAVTTDRARDDAPAWDGEDALLFASDRAGVSEIWRIGLAGGPPERITHDGPNTYPAVSPDGRRLACVRRGSGVAVLERDRGVGMRWPSPREVVSAPAWSPDGRVIAVAADAWERVDIYLLAADATRAMRIAYGPSRTTSPCWRPDDRGLLAIVESGGRASLTAIDGLDAHIARLRAPASARTLVPR